MSSSSEEHDIGSDDEVAIIAVCKATQCTSEYFQSLEFGDQNYVDQSREVIDQLELLMRMHALFRTLTNFTIEEWSELCKLVCPIIEAHARSTGELREIGGRSVKLDAAQRLLNCIIFLKHDNTIVFESSHWNWSKSSSCDNYVFIASCINEAIRDEICWPSSEERHVLGMKILEFLGCIGIIDGTLCKIRRPHEDPEHGRWFNGRKKIYFVNNIVVVDHNGLFIYIDSAYPGSFHDVNILQHSTLMVEWRSRFSHIDEYFEYLLGDPNYQGEDQFIMRMMSPIERYLVANPSVVAAFNKMHSSVRVGVEWEIGGIKNKWRRLMKQFDNTKGKFTIYFTVACLLTNFLHRQRMDMHGGDNGEILDNLDEFGWDGDY